MAASRKRRNHEKSLLEMLRVLFSNRMKVEDKEEILSSQYGMIMETGTGKEIDDMCNFADYIEEEAMERGLKRGGTVKLIEQVCRKLIKGKTPETIAEELEEDPVVVEGICRAAAMYAPDYNTEKIFDKYMEMKS